MTYNEALKNVHYLSNVINGTVNVFNFKHFDINLDKFIVSMSKAPRCIIDSLGFIVIEDSVENVKCSLLDTCGFYCKAVIK